MGNVSSPGISIDFFTKMFIFKVLEVNWELNMEKLTSFHSQMTWRMTKHSLGFYLLNPQAQWLV